jgi:hypothetical protein
MLALKLTALTLVSSCMVLPPTGGPMAILPHTPMRFLLPWGAFWLTSFTMLGIIVNNNMSFLTSECAF